MLSRAQQDRSCVVILRTGRVRVRARAAALVFGGGARGARGTGAVDMQAVGIGGTVVIHAAGNGGSQALRQRVGGECLRRLMSMLSYAMDASAAPSAALAAATERPSAVIAAIVEWGMVPQIPTATITSGSKLHVCVSCAPGTRRATEAHGTRAEAHRRRANPATQPARRCNVRPGL